MAEVEVIKAVDGPILRKRDYEGNPLVITRQRVAAYVRVSTDDDEQLESFQSQKKYYQEKISENRDWVMVGIYADEAITGTKVDKREQFQRMIQDCLDGKIDVIMTKSVSRFSRNTVDILQYVRLLKERGIAVIFEKENINTMTEQGEMMLTLMGTLAQNEVESTSKNVKMGIKMKMKRGELVEKVIVGETNEDGTVDPFKLTFVMKGNGNSIVPNAKEWFKAEKSTTKTA